ncbi:MAG: hypothetical protein EOP50_12410 [Sphingobacteriales bacterium]|nr:MAG: hypothetical protein EOP50_12410 [Sphingobacteriales bacterium]
MKIVENVAVIETKLRNEFWDLVTEKLEDLVFGLDRALTFKKNENWFDVSKESWDFYYVATEKEDVGIHLREHFRSKVDGKHDLIKELVEKYSPIIAKFENIGWPCWKTFNMYRFNENAQKLRILPDVRDEMVSECASHIFNYIQTCIKMCDELNKELKGASVGILYQ